MTDVQCSVFVVDDIILHNLIHVKIHTIKED